jgi:hypothetical protein
MTRQKGDMRRRAISRGDGWYSYQRQERRTRPPPPKKQRHRGWPHHPPKHARTLPVAPRLQTLIPTPAPNITPFKLFKETAQSNPTNTPPHLLSQQPPSTAFTMFPKSMPTIPTTHPQQPLTNQPFPTYTQVLLDKPGLSEPTTQQPALFRFMQLVWHHFIDHNLWQPLEQHEPLLDVRPLPLPPDSNHPAWIGRCYNCLVCGHNQNDCRQMEWVCALCRQRAHQAKHCQVGNNAKRRKHDPLQPRGNVGDQLLLTGRPQVLNIYIPDTPALKADTQQLEKGVIIDARLKENHTVNNL